VNVPIKNHRELTQKETSNMFFNSIFPNDISNIILEYSGGLGILKILTGHTGEVTHIEIITNKKFVTGSTDTTLRIWDLNSNNCLHILSGHHSIITALTVLKDSLIIVSAYEDMTINFWDSNNGNLLNSIKIDIAIKYFRQNNNNLFACDRDSLYSIDINTLNIKLIRKFSSEYTDLSDKTLIILSDNNFIIPWWYNHREGGLYSSSEKYFTIRKEYIDKKFKASTTSVVKLPDGRIVSGYSDGYITIHDVEGNKYNDLNYKHMMSIGNPNTIRYTIDKIVPLSNELIVTQIIKYSDEQDLMGPMRVFNLKTKTIEYDIDPGNGIKNLNKLSSTKIYCY